MENVADALKIAGAVLIFVTALSIIILSFGQLREATDTIIDYKDRETMYIDSSFYYQEVEGGIRTVNLETIIPSIFRAYLENYKIVFEGLEELNKPIYKIVQNDGNVIEKYSLDLETNQNTEYQNVTLANDEKKREFLCGILYRDFNGAQKEDFEKEFNVDLNNCESLYDLLEDATSITEKLGVYYQNDDDPTKPNVNKVEKRIITYTLKH